MDDTTTLSIKTYFKADFEGDRQGTIEALNSSTGRSVNMSNAVSYRIGDSSSFAPCDLSVK